MQSKIASLAESKLNVLIGFPINYSLNVLFVNLFGNQLMDNDHRFYMLLSVTATILAITRSYLIRRFFNAKTKDISCR